MLRIVLLVRHADIKLPPTSSDPPLSAAGRERAQALRYSIARAGVTALFTSSLRRTKETVAPLAAMLGLQPREADDLPALVKELRSGAAGAVPLVAGHSNTVPNIIDGLIGSPQSISIGEREFDNLFVVSVGQGGEPATLSLRYGRPSGR